ncbi:MAG: SagB/ThcOx family dehydrogenase [Chloroflexota bacterium]
MSKRRSRREYQDAPITQAELAQLCWAALGITEQPDRRTAPSAGALNPLELCVAAGNVGGLSPGVYRYLPREHALKELRGGDQREGLYSAALAQEMILQAPLILAISAVHERTTWKYGGRGIQYVHMEVGAAAQNVYLQCVSLGLGTVFVGAFQDQAVKEALGLPEDERPLCLLPVGKILEI